MKYIVTTLNGVKMLIGSLPYASQSYFVWYK